MPERSRSRRLTLALLLVACGVLVSACRDAPEGTRLAARPDRPTESVAPGEHRLGIGWEFYRGMRRDGTLVVPTSATSPVPLLILLHGGGGRSEDFRHAYPIGMEFGVAILSLDARDNTWDAIDGPFGPDVRFLDAALRYTFERVAVDPARIALGGVSDGGMYALSLGRANGDLFTHLVAVAPGFMVSAGPAVGRPRIFLAHGTRDRVYNLSGTKLRLYPELRRAGYDVTFHEFDGPHSMPADVARTVLAWLKG